MTVLTLAMSCIILYLTLLSRSWPKPRWYVPGARPTMVCCKRLVLAFLSFAKLRGAGRRNSRREVRRKREGRGTGRRQQLGRRKHTACEESVFGGNADGIEEEDGDCLLEGVVVSDRESNGAQPDNKGPHCKGIFQGWTFLRGGPPCKYGFVEMGGVIASALMASGVSFSFLCFVAPNCLDPLGIIRFL